MRGAPPNSARIERFRAQVAEQIPCDPPTAALREDLHAMPLHELLFVYVQWASRLVRPAPRDVVWLPEFWKSVPSGDRREVDALIGRIVLGEDITTFLSERVLRHGYAPIIAGKRSARGIDWDRMDLAVNAWGVHHLHLRTNRSNKLLFVQFARTWAGLICLGDHKSFHSGALEDAVVKWRAGTDQLQIKGAVALSSNHTPAERTALARHGIATAAEVGGKVVLSSMISTAGTSVHTGAHVDRIVSAIERVDPKLDGGVISDEIPAAELIQLKGRAWAWRMNAGDLILVEEVSNKGFIFAQGEN